MDQLSYLECKSPADRNVSILPLPFNIGSDNLDTAAAPDYFLKRGMKRALESVGFSARVLPEIVGRQALRSNSSENFEKTVNTIRAISVVAKREVSRGRKVLGLGGDHTISIGTIAGASEALQGDLGVIWIDAHGDMHTHETSLSGNIHGMGSALIMGIGKKILTDLIKVKIKKQNILYIGLKDLDQAEIDLIRTERLAVVTMPEIIEHGYAPIKKQVDKLLKKVSHLWISLDVDSIDKEYAPASAMATSGSLSYREITNIMNYVGKSAYVAGMDVCEVTPRKDRNGKTARLCTELVASAFGSKYSWYTEYMNPYHKST